MKSSSHGKLALVLIALSKFASANSSGDQVAFRDNSFDCSAVEKTFASATVNVAVPSHILVTARLNAIGSDKSGTFSVAVADAQTNTETGTTGAAFSVSSTVYNQITIEQSEFPSLYADGTNMLLQPGTYVLNMQGYLDCGASSKAGISGVLGWVLLSSVYDRLFADGFGATS